MHGRQGAKREPPRDGEMVTKGERRGRGRGTAARRDGEREAKTTGDPGRQRITGPEESESTGNVPQAIKHRACSGKQGAR